MRGAQTRRGGERRVGVSVGAAMLLVGREEGSDGRLLYTRVDS